MSKFAWLALAVFVPLGAFAQETVVLRDGTQIQGRIVGATDNSVSFRSRDGDVRNFDIRQIDVIRFDHDGDRDRGRDNRGDNTPPPPPGPIRQSYSGDGRGYNAPPPPPPDSYMTLPAGTSIAVRTNESVNTRDSDGRGRSYSAQVDQDVMDGSGNVLIPRGSDARLVVRRIRDNNLALDLQSVTVNGQTYTVNTNDVVQGSGRDGVGANKRTAEFAGGGALLGTLLGAAAGGGKGAAIGALAGGAAGVGTQVLTSGSEVRVPAESVLTFRLDSPMTLMPVRQ